MTYASQTSKAIMSDDDDDSLNPYSGSGSGSGTFVTVISSTTTTTSTVGTKADASPHDPFSRSGSKHSMTSIREFHDTTTPDVVTTKGPVPLSPQEGKEQDCIPIVAAGACGFVVVVVIIVVIIILCRRRKSSGPPKEDVDSNSKPPSYSTAIEMSAAKRSTLEVRPVNNATFLYSATESERNVNPPPTTEGKCPPSTEPVDCKSSPKTSNGQSKVDESLRHDYQNEKYSHLSTGSHKEVGTCNKYETFHDYENRSEGNGQTGMSAEISEHVYDEV